MTEIKVKMERWREGSERVQYRRGRQEITHSAYLKEKEGYSDERETEGEREGGVVKAGEMMTAAP